VLIVPIARTEKKEEKYALDLINKSMYRQRLTVSQYLDLICLDYQM